MLAHAVQQEEAELEMLLELNSRAGLEGKVYELHELTDGTYHLSGRRHQHRPSGRNVHFGTTSIYQFRHLSLLGLGAMGECWSAERLFEMECRDALTGGSRMARGEWMALQYLKEEGLAGRAGRLGDELISLAQQDVREAENFYAAASVWHSDWWSPVAHDADLLKFLAVVYLSRLLLDDQLEFQACASSLEGLVTSQELNCLLHFAHDLVSPARPPEQLSVVTNNGSDAVAMEKEDKHSKEEGVELASAFLERMWTSFFSAACSPTSKKFAELADSVVRSLYFLTPPRRDEGPACASLLVFLRTRLSEELENEEVGNLLEQMERDIFECYKAGAMVLGKEDWNEYFARSMEHCEADWGPLTAPQLKEVIEACKSPGLASLLFSRKPPNSIFSSHRLAVFDCVTYARLFLLRYRLPVYCHYKHLTYASLGQDVELENKVMQSVDGFLGRIPSYVERLLRREALLEINECWCQSGGNKLVYNVSVPICTRLKVPTYLKDVHDAFRYEEGWCNELAALPGALWYESKVRFWLGIDGVEGETFVIRPNHALMERYQSMSKFMDFLAPDAGEGPLEFLA